MLTYFYRYYVNLQKIYQAKAEKDCNKIESYVREILKRIGRDTDSIPKSVIKTFCRNSRKLKVYACFFTFEYSPLGALRYMLVQYKDAIRCN